MNGATREGLRQRVRNAEQRADGEQPGQLRLRLAQRAPQHVVEHPCADQRADGKRERLHVAQRLHRGVDEVRAAVPAGLAFDEYVFGCLCHVIEKAPSSPLFTLDIARDTDLDPVALYFASPDIIAGWVELFRGPYTEALRARTLKPDVALEKLVAWFGRITTSYLKYPLPGETPEEIRDSLRVFFIAALRPTVADARD